MNTEQQDNQANESLFSFIQKFKKEFNKDPSHQTMHDIFIHNGQQIEHEFMHKSFAGRTYISYKSLVKNNLQLWKQNLLKLVDELFHNGLEAQGKGEIADIIGLEGYLNDGHNSGILTNDEYKTTFDATVNVLKKNAGIRIPENEITEEEKESFKRMAQGSVGEKAEETTNTEEEQLKAEKGQEPAIKLVESSGDDSGKNSKRDRPKR